MDTLVRSLQSPMQMVSRKPQPKPIVLFVFGLWIIWGFGYQSLWKRLVTNVEGTVVSVRDIPSPLAPARHGTEYAIRTADGNNISYTAGATDASLPRSMPIGTTIEKKRWHFSYERNGHKVEHFNVVFYVVTLSAAVGVLIWAVRLTGEPQP
jgi:hypothetical protein